MTNVTINEKLSNVESIDQLEDIIQDLREKDIEITLNTMQDETLHFLVKYNKELDKECQIVNNWINERLSSGYYAYMPLVLQGLRKGKNDIKEIQDGLILTV